MNQPDHFPVTVNALVTTCTRGFNLPPERITVVDLRRRHVTIDDRRFQVVQSSSRPQEPLLLELDDTGRRSWRLGYAFSPLELRDILAQPPPRRASHIRNALEWIAAVILCCAAITVSWRLLWTVWPLGPLMAATTLLLAFVAATTLFGEPRSPTTDAGRSSPPATNDTSGPSPRVG